MAVASFWLLVAIAAGPSHSHGHLPTKAQLRACPKLANLDFARVEAMSRKPPDTVPVPRSASVSAKTRGGQDFEPPADAQIVLSTWAGPSETQESPTETSS